MKKQNVKTDHRSHFLVVIETIYEQLVHTLIGSPYCSPLIRFAYSVMFAYFARSHDVRTE